MVRWDFDALCEALEAEIGRFGAVVREADPARAVPTCPGWVVADLVKHHGTSLRWATQIVRERARGRIWSRDVELGLPEDVAGYVDWFDAAAGPLLATLREAGPDATVWNVFGDEHRARFWARRMLFEAVVHRCDAELALGRRPRIDAATAAEGIDEFLTCLPGWQRALPDDHSSLHLHATDPDTGEWMIRLTADGFRWEHDHGRATVAVRGSAGDLLLLLYNRLPADDLTVFGDQRLLDGWLAGSVL